MSRFALSPEARRDLLDIKTYIARDSPRRAASYIAELLAACRRAAQQPLGYPEAPFVKGYRQTRHKPYLILYTVRPGSIRIERILHSARDLPALFDEN